MDKLIDCRAEGSSHRNKMVPLPSPSGPMLTGGPFPHPHPQRDLTFRSTTIHPPYAHNPRGWGKVETTGPSPLRSRFLFKISSHPALSPQQKPESLLGKRLRVAAVPSPLSSPAPMNSYQEPSGLPLLPGSSNSALSHYRI